MAETPPDWFVEPSFWRRLGGFAFDVLILVIAVGALATILGPQIPAVVTLLISAVYFTAGVAWRGQTIGKHLFGTRVVEIANGEVPSLARSALRWFVWGGVVQLAGSALGVPAAPLQLWPIVVALPVLVGPLHRGIHDRIAGTVVEAVPLDP